MSNTNTQEVATLEPANVQAQVSTQVNNAAFSDDKSFNHTQRVAIMMAKSDLVPERYRGDKNVPNVMIAIEMAYRIGASPLQVMQSLNIIKGTPSWSSQFIIAKINSCGEFTKLRFKTSGKGETLACLAYARDKETGETLEGPEITMAMAKAEGWATKEGSKWKTMPELMIQYRAAAFFGRLYAPELMMGMHTTEEVVDMSENTGKRAIDVADNKKSLQNKGQVELP